MKSENRKKHLKKIIICMILLIVTGIIGAEIYIGYVTVKYKNINLSGLNTEEYVQAADNASKGKLQVNWKYMAAIDGVRYKNDFSKVTDSSVNQLANMFIEENSTNIKVKNNEYKLLDLDVVMDKLTLDKAQKEKVYDYIDDLKYIGAKKNKLTDSSQQEFIKELYPQAKELYDKYGILPSITISQAVLESGWGKSELSIQAKNLFGIKADASWKGKKIKMKTSEYYNEKIEDYFRAYNNNSESVKDYGEFLNSNKRYKQSGVFQAAQYLEQAKAIEKAGYSTVENDKGEEIYAELLVDIIQEQNLQLLDYECEMDYLESGQ